MKKFLLKLSLLGLPIICLLLALLFAPVDKKFAYHYLEGDFSKAAWIYKSIFTKEAPLDVVFIGTSHTLNGVNDSLIQMKLNQQLDKTIKVSNLSLNHPGANAHYAIVKDLLKKKKPKMLILEVREVEARFSHFAFPIIADKEDVLLPELFPNVFLFRDYMYRIQSRYSYYKHQLVPRQENITEWNQRSFGYLPNSNSISAEELEKHLQAKLNSPLFYLGEDFRDIEFGMGKKYMQKIHLLAKENNVELVFLYLPFFGAPVERPVEYDFYSQMGEIWSPPSEILDAPEHWSDLYHVNDVAATKLAAWITDKLAQHPQLIREGKLDPLEQEVLQSN